MPVGMQPRPHQVECLRHVRERNTIVNMPTGTGKTLVAVLAIDAFRNSGKAMFLVPTRPLVTQQAEYVRKNASGNVAVQELQGAQTDHLTATEWRDIVASNDVLVGTAEVFRRALVDTRFISLDTFSLLVFDECHNAVGNSPMAAIMRDCVHRCTGKQPRILGLTASFVNGSLAGIEKKRKDLEGLMQACIFCPSVDERPMEFKHVAYAQSVRPEMEQLVEDKVKALLGLAEQCGVPTKEYPKVVQRGIHVFTELGLAAFIYYLRECVAPQVQRHIETALEHLPSGYRSGPNEALQHIPRLRQAMRDAADRLASDGSLTAYPNITDKAAKLLELIRTLQEDGAGTRIIVFTEQTVLAHPLAHLLQTDTGNPVGTCTGVGSMTDGQRKQALKSFRSGQVPLLTCTAALEEGLDVSECEVVIRFSKFQTTKSHIQGSGRARAWNARVFYFDNNPQEELASADLMERTAKMSHLALSSSEMQASREHADVQGVHPYRTGAGAEISVFNCVQLVNEYAARTLGASFRPSESMYHYSEETTCGFPPQRRKVLTAVTVPSPDGFFKVDKDEVDAWWGDVDVEDVENASRMKNWDASDTELRRFIYVVAVALSQKGFLDGHNQPSSRALRDTRHVCEAWKMSSGVRIGTRYESQGADPGPGPAAGPRRQAAAAAGTPQARASPAQASAQQRALPSPPQQPAPNTKNLTATVPSPGLPGAAPQGNVAPTNAPAQNYKGVLNAAYNGSAVYDTAHEGGGFRSTVTLPDGRSFRGMEVVSTKKAAEQFAAKAAIEASQQQQQQQTQQAQQTQRPPQPQPQQQGQLPRGPAPPVSDDLASRAPAPQPQGHLPPGRAPPACDSLASQVLALLLGRGEVALRDIVRQCGAAKQDVNRELYSLERQGRARKVVDSPPVWSAVV